MNDLKDRSYFRGKRDGLIFASKFIEPIIISSLRRRIWLQNKISRLLDEAFRQAYISVNEDEAGLKGHQPHPKKPASQDPVPYKVRKLSVEELLVLKSKEEK